VFWLKPVPRIHSCSAKHNKNPFTLHTAPVTVNICKVISILAKLPSRHQNFSSNLLLRPSLSSITLCRCTGLPNVSATRLNLITETFSRFAFFSLILVVQYKSRLNLPLAQKRVLSPILGGCLKKKKKEEKKSLNVSNEEEPSIAQRVRNRRSPDLEYHSCLYQEQI
jgi:hypothetical protein